MALGNAIPASRTDLLAALPERSVVGRLVSRYFNSNDPAMSKVPAVVTTESILTILIVIIHKPTFQKEVGLGSYLQVVFCQGYSCEQYVKWQRDSELFLLIESEHEFRKAFLLFLSISCHTHIDLTVQSLTFSGSLLSLLTNHKVSGVLGQSIEQTGYVDWTSLCYTVPSHILFSPGWG
jgi:hypothetical protein